MIPEFEDNGNLPRGIHPATIEQVEERFAKFYHRHMLFNGLIELLKALKDCDCRTVYLDGSFITIKERPGDYDVCYDPTGMNLDRFYNRYPLSLEKGEKQKIKYKGEFKNCTKIAEVTESGAEINYLHFFQRDKYNHETPKGILAINLELYDKKLERIKGI